MPPGGARLSAGRISNAEIVRARQLIDDTLCDADWKTIIRTLADLAASGERGAPQAAHILLAYRFGVPTKNERADFTVQVISSVVVEGPREPKSL